MLSKNKIKITGILLSAIIMTGCSYEKAKVSENKNMKIGVLNVVDSGVLYVAENENMFKKNGINVDLVKFSSAADQSKAIEGGGVDAILTDPIVQSMVSKGDKKLKEVCIAVGEKPENGKFFVVASPKTKHNEVKKLEGAKIGISKGTMMEFLLDSYCELLGVNVDKIEKVNIPSLSLRAEALLQNKIDDAVLPESLGELTMAKGAKLVVDDTKLKENLSESIIAFDSDYINKNKDAMEKFMKSYIEAAKEINNNPQKYKNIILKESNVPQKLWSKFSIPYYNTTSVTDKKLFNRVQTWLIRNKLIKKPFIYNDMVDSSFIDKLKK